MLGSQKQKYGFEELPDSDISDYEPKAGERDYVPTKIPYKQPKIEKPVEEEKHGELNKVESGIGWN